MSINRQEFTNAGRDMLGRANNGEVLTIAHVVVGETRVNAPGDLWPLDVIPGYVMDVVITQQTDQGDGVLLIDAAFNSSQAPRAFELCGVGVMAHIAAEPDRLYSVANVLATGADNVDPAVESIHAFKIKVVIDRAPNVTVVIGTSQDIMGENIGAATVGAGVFSDKLANTLRFKRFVMGPDIEITEDNETVTIGRKVLLVNLNLFVDLGAPDIFPNYSTIPNALAYLADYNIPSNITATITVGPGRWIGSDAINVTHPNSSQIIIQGTVAPDKAVTGVTAAANFVTFSGAPGTFSDMSGQDGFLFFGAAGGIAGQSVSGAWRVSAIAGDGSSVTAFTSFSPPTVNGAGITGTIIYLQSYLDFASGISGFYLPNGLQLLRNLFLFGNIGAQPIFGVTTAGGKGSVTIFQCGATNWVGTNSTGFHCTSGAQMGISNSGSCINEQGIYVAGSTFTANGVYCTGNNYVGFNLTSGSSSTLSNSGAFGTGVSNPLGGDGIVYASLSFLFIGNCWSESNTRHGIYGTDGAQCSTYDGNWFSGNNLNPATGGFGVNLRVLSSFSRATGTINTVDSTNWVPVVITDPPQTLQISADGCFYSNPVASQTPNVN
jgi:hypothetical protein